MIVGQNFKFLQSLCIVKLDLEITFVDVLEWSQSDPDDIWGCQIWSAAILDFFPKGLAYDFGRKYQISLKFVYSQFEPKNNICWCLRVKLTWFWRYMKMSNLISRHLGLFSKGVRLALSWRNALSWRKTMHYPDADALSWREPRKGF